MKSNLKIANEPKFESTAISEYLDVVRNEYEIELQKKSSFESRAGIIIAFIGTICVFLFDKIDLTKVAILLHEPLSFISLFKLISLFLIYFSIVAAFLSSIKTISIRKFENFEVKGIDTELLSESRSSGCARIIFTYKSIIIDCRKNNHQKAKHYRNSLIFIFILFLSIFVYINT